MVKTKIHEISTKSNGANLGFEEKWRLSKKERY